MRLQSASLPAAAMTADLFALNVEYLPATTFPTLPFKTLRIWDAGNTWADIATADGVYDTTQHDAVMDTIPPGTPVIYAFGKVPNWASGTSDIANPPTDNRTWTDFVTFFVNHNLARRAAGKSGITHWELWNEFNLSDFWKGTTAQMVTMASLAYPIIKALDPASIVFNASTTNATGANDLAAYFAAGGAAWLDQVAIHAYTIQVETLLTLIPSYKAAMARYGLQGKQLWSTEGGYGLNANLPSDDARAGSVVRYYFLLGLMGVCSGGWYAFDTTAWGTLSPDGGAKLGTAGHAYQAAQSWLVGAAPVAHSARGSAHEGRLTRPNGYAAYLAWDTGAGSNYTPPAGVTQYRDILGTITPYSSGAVAIGLKPLLFETGNP